MTSYVVRQDQTIFDVVVMFYGDISFLYQFMNDNPQINGIHDIILGQTIFYNEKNTALTAKFKQENIIIVTALPAVNEGRSFDNSFDFSFR